jgi:hypothetical protein
MPKPCHDPAFNNLDAHFCLVLVLVLVLILILILILRLIGSGRYDGSP